LYPRPFPALRLLPRPAVRERACEPSRSSPTHRRDPRTRSGRRAAASGPLLAPSCDACAHVAGRPQRGRRARRRPPGHRIGEHACPSRKPIRLLRVATLGRFPTIPRVGKLRYGRCRLNVRDAPRSASAELVPALPAGESRAPSRTSAGCITNTVARAEARALLASRNRGRVLPRAPAITPIARRAKPIGRAALLRARRYSTCDHRIGVGMGFR